MATQRFLTNPGGTMKSVRKHGRKVTRAAWAKSGYRRNTPTKRQLAARKKFTAMAKARAVAVRRKKRAPTSEATMARRKRKAAHRRKTGRRVGRARRSRTSRARVVYMNAPRKRGRRRGVRGAHARRGHRRLRRNPSGLSLGGVKSSLMTLGVGVGAAFVGMAAGNFIATNVTPKIFAPSATDTPQSVALRNLGIAAAASVALVMFGKRIAPPLAVYSAAIGLLIIPAKNALTAYAPGSSSFLGGSPMAMPRFRQPDGRISGGKPVGAYPRPNMGAYPQISSYPQGMQPA